MINKEKMLKIALNALLIGGCVLSIGLFGAAEPMDVDGGATAPNSLIVQDINVLKPYCLPIKHILTKLDSFVKQYSSYRYYLYSEPKLDPRDLRTPNHLFLETSLNKKGEALLHSLYTPFGGFMLLPGAWVDKPLTISNQFLAQMEWELEDVTKRVHVYDYVQDSNCKYGPGPFKKEPWQGAGTKSMLYLIKSVKAAGFVESVPADEELIILGNFVLTEGQGKKDQQQFQRLSSDKTN